MLKISERTELSTGFAIRFFFIRTILIMTISTNCHCSNNIDDNNNIHNNINNNNYNRNHNYSVAHSLWEDLYFGCGSSVSFRCVQNKLADYVNDTLNSDIRLSEGIYFVKTDRSLTSPLSAASSTKNPTSPASILSSISPFVDNAVFYRLVEADNINNINNNNRNRVKVSRSERSIYNDTTMNHTTNEISIPVEIGDNNFNNNELLAEDEDEKQRFSSFVDTLENVERDLENNNRYNSSHDDIKRFNNISNEHKTSPTIWSLYSLTDILYDKASRYLTTHDLHLCLPSVLFGGARLQISPRGFDAEDGGILLKFNVFPIAESPRNGGNAAGHNNGFVSKYFHKVFKKKLLTSFLALLLIIKLIKIKLMYVLPLLIGVNHAKKLLLKTLLFLFPPLVHLFKLCTFYHAHASKLHFHHHKVKHHHHHIKVPVPVPIPVPVHKPHYSTHEDEYPPGPSLSPSDYPAIEPYGHPTADHPTQEVYPSSNNHNGYPTGAAGPTDDYYNKNDLGNLQKHSDEFASWGLKDFYASTESPGVLSAQAQAFSPYAEQNYNKYATNHNGLGTTYNGANVYNSRISNYPTGSGISYKDPYNVNVKKNKNTNSWKSKQPIGGSFTSQGVSSKNSPTVLVAYDPFYSPILQKIDALFTQLGFNDEGCRERLICSMYKNPVRFSPHSNLLSTELSRDPDELQRPVHNNNAAVIRFYRYVDAARNGQAQKDCLKLYTTCTVKTE